MSVSESIREAIGRLIHLVYNKRIRPHLPRTTAEYNGVTVKRAYLFDKYLPWLPYNKPQYEQGLLDGIEVSVSEGDTVVIIGGGSGVSSIYSARAVGESGSVHTYEASSEMLEKLQDTFQRNDFPDVVTLHHGIVGEAVHVWGDSELPSVIPTSNLPESDVLVVDAEGAELQILDNLDYRPDDIIVETHGLHDAPPNDVKGLLRNLGYDIINEVIAEPRNPEMCRENGVFVLRATYSSE